MFKKVLIISTFVFLGACGTIEYHPPVFGLSETKIPDFKVQGDVQIENIQDSVEPTIIHSYGGTSYQSNYKEITNTMVTQAEFELARHGDSVGGASDKKIGLKVTYLNSNYIAFYWKGTMTFAVVLGDADPFEITVNHSTGAGAAQDLSGSIADGVVALFKDERVSTYLAQ